jgi:hypothetical protein
MKTLALFAVVAMLGGCAARPERAVTVEVVVPVACQIAVPEAPAMPTDELSLDAPVDVQARYMRAEIILREAYEQTLVTALTGCRQLP